MTFRNIVYALIALLAVQSCVACSQPAPKIGVYNLQSQRISGAQTVRVKGADAMAQASVLVTVDVAGNVIEAKQVADMLDGGLDASAAVAAARAWKFQPQSFDGKPIQAVGEIRIGLSPLEIPPNKSAPFPVAAADDVEITLERSACFWSCPEYRVTISGNGKVRFSTPGINTGSDAANKRRSFNGANVIWPGTHEATISPEAVAALVEKFRASHFMGMRSKYVAGITDSATHILTLRIGKSTKRVVNYVGEAIGMPASITALEDAVDQLAGTDRWVRGNAQTIAALKAQGFDFTSQEAALLVQAVIDFNDGARFRKDANDLIQAVISEGLDLSTSVDIADSGRDVMFRPIGSVIAQYAAESGDVDLFEAMARAAFVARMDKKDLNATLLSGTGCNPRIATALVEAGADPTTSDNLGNALHRLGDDYGRCARLGGDARTKMAKVLVSLGVPIEARNSLGTTPLMGCTDPEIALSLLAAGANPNARYGANAPAIMTVYDDRVALLFLRAGADPKAKDKNATLRQLARNRRWPGTLAWLDQHGIE